MHARARTAIAAAAVVLAGLALTACGSEKAGNVNTAGGTPTSTTPSTAPTTTTAPVASRTTAPVKSPTTKPSPTKSTAGGQTGTVACTTKNTRVRFIASPFHANEEEPASATVKVTNTSHARCTIVGPSVLTAKDDQGKATPITADNAADSKDAVDLKPGATATASVEYADVNFQGTASARGTCAVQASKVELALPDDTARAVRVTKSNGTAAIFNVCGPGVKFDGFAV
jgi:hypothetical protein